MKKFTTFILIALSLSLYSQVDLQWIISEGHGKDGLINYNRNSYHSADLDNTFIVEGVSNPNPSNNNNNPRNDFFFIFEDGTYEMHQIDQNLVATNYIFGDPLKKVIFGYLANIYEEDDPPEDVKVNDYSSSLANIPDPIPPIIEPIFPVHDIVDTKDFTIVFDENNVQIDNDVLNYEFELSNPANSNSKKCFNYVHEQGNSFFNFTSYIDDTDVLKQTISLELYCNGQYIHRTSPRTEILINSYFHDPNFVKVECVWVDNETPKVKYKVSCYNELPGTTGPVSLSVQLPPHVDATTVEILEWEIGNGTDCIDDCGNPLFIEQDEAINNNVVMVEFDQNYSLAGLDPGDDPECNQIAWFTFCADVDCNLSDINRIPLYVNDPHSTFYPQSYPITTFIDQFQELGEPGFYRRPITENCSDCQCCETFCCRFRRFLNLPIKKEPVRIPTDIDP